jgi:hypothetical protein
MIKTRSAKQYASVYFAKHNQDFVYIRSDTKHFICHCVGNCRLSALNCRLRSYRCRAAMATRGAFVKRFDILEPCLLRSKKLANQHPPHLSPIGFDETHVPAFTAISSAPDSNIIWCRPDNVVVVVQGQRPSALCVRALSTVMCSQTSVHKYLAKRDVDFSYNNVYIWSQKRPSQDGKRLNLFTKAETA